MQGRLFFLNTPSPDRPVEDKYVAEIENSKRISFMEQNDALMYLFDNGVQTYQYFTKEVSAYKSLKQIQTYELLKIENRVGYVLYDYERYIDEGNNIKKRKAYVWRFVGFGKPCFAATKEELRETVIKLIAKYKLDPDKRGLNTYPYFTKYYR